MKSMASVQVLPSQVLVRRSAEQRNATVCLFSNCTNHWREPNRKAQLETRLLQPGETMTAKIVAYAGRRCCCSKPVIRKVDAPRL